MKKKKTVAVTAYLFNLIISAHDFNESNITLQAIIFPEVNFPFEINDDNLFI